MMKFITWQIKRWLIPALVMIGVMCLSMAISAGQEAIIKTVYHNEYHDYVLDTGNSLFMVLILYSSIISFVFPMFVFNYKFGIRRADFYKQLPFEPKHLRRIILTMGLIIILIGVTLAFMLSIGIYALRYITYDRSALQNTVDYTEMMMNLDWKVLIYFYLLLIASSFATYSLTSLFVYHNTSVFEALIAAIAVQLLLGLLSFSILEQVSTIVSRMTNGAESPKLITLSFSVITPVIAGYQMNEMFVSSRSSFPQNFLWNLTLYLGCGVGSFIWLFLIKDRSADKENEKGRPSIITLIAIHGGFLSLLLFFARLMAFQLFVGLLVYIFTIATYFFINVLYRHGFKLRLEQWIPMTIISIVGLVDLISLASIFHNV